jgi:hypothetical protein
MIAILVPVLGRAHQIEPLVQNITLATGSPHQIILIVSPDDPAAKTARTTTATVMTATWQPEHADYAKKLALGYHNTDEPWLFQAATDLVFHPGWDLHALTVAERTGCQVIGTNDLGNPLVKRGTHSTHTLIARDYIATQGGTADDSGVIFSEAYDHQWSDSEFIETARRRRTFAFSKRSVVEHLHPHWGKADMDPTYEKAHRSTTDDMRLFTERRRTVTRLDQLARRK